MTALLCFDASGRGRQVSGCFGRSFSPKQERRICTPRAIVGQPVGVGFVVMLRGANPPEALCGLPFNASGLQPASILTTERKDRCFGGSSCAPKQMSGGWRQAAAPKATAL